MPNDQPLVKAKDVTYVRLSAPDLDLMEQFVGDFGLVVVHRDDDSLRVVAGDVCLRVLPLPL